MRESLADRLERFDRRWIFLAMALAIVIPLKCPLNLPQKHSPPVKALYEAVESLPPGAPVLVSADLDPAATPELQPFFQTVVLHLKRKKARIIFLTTWYQAPPLMERWIREYVDKPIAPGDVAYERCTDDACLGFREGKEALIANLGQDLVKAYGGVNADGKPLSEIPAMQGLTRLKDFSLLVLISAGYPGAKEYVQQVGARYQLPMIAVCTAVSTTDLAPYYDAGQLLGLAGGMSAVAEYEEMVGYPDGLAVKGRDVLNVGHLVVILAILFGNFIYFYGRRRRRA